jgi:hypothetical protein
MVQISNLSARLKPLPAPVPRQQGDTRPAMICRHVFDSIGIHANGDIVCWDVDVHGKHVYGNVFKDRIADVYNGPRYREIREWFLKSRPDTWCPAVNHHCPLRTVPAQADERIDNCRIRTIRLEPVTYCNLHCPVCPVETSFKHDPVVRETRAHKLLPLEVMLDVVAQLPDLELMEYYGYGEPFLHKDTVSFLREVRRTRPDITISTSTSGTVMTPTQIQPIAAEALMDRVVFSIDGATAESYRRYRVGGTFSKALGKMQSLVDACRAAGTWRRYASDPRGGAQITWQYILFEWNDSDEELALARDLARSIGVPIEWVITSGYGASKRFLHGSPEAARLMEPPDSFIHMAANAEIDSLLAGRGINHLASYHEISARCELLALPYTDGHKYKARFSAAESSINVPTGASITFAIDVENHTDQSWDAAASNSLRLGVRLQGTGRPTTELNGMMLPPATTRPDGASRVLLPINLPAEPGNYKLTIDVVQEGVCWFLDRGSRPLKCSVRIINDGRDETPLRRAIRLIGL